MKKAFFTAVLTLMGSSFLFAQQWTGANNTTSDISRTGKVSINTTNTNENLNINGTIGIFGGYGIIANPPKTSIAFYSNSTGGTPIHEIATRQNMTLNAYNPSVGFITTSLYIGSVIDKSIVITNNKIGMGTHVSFYNDDYRLYVKDGIRTEKIKVEIAANNGWADYVFEPGYNLMSLTEVEQFIKENGHLPEVPTTEEAIENGIELKEMNILLLKKVEELTLYSIELQKRIEALESQTTHK